MELNRLPEETELQHHKRLIYGKLIDKTLADADYTELAEAVYGQTYSSDVARRMMYGSCRTLQLLDAETEEVVPVDMLSEIETQRTELRKERQKLFDERAAYNRLVRERARQEELNEILLRAVAEGDLPRLNYTPAEPYESDNDLLVSLNDIHYGADVSNYWTVYNPDICRQMMRNYLDRIISIGRTHKSQRCIVWQNGDAISGNIHYSIAVTNKENVVKQIKGVSELIAEFLAELSRHFEAVAFVSVSGNHSRINPNKNLALPEERLDDLIEWYLEARLQNFDNVTIGYGSRLDSTMYIMDVRGKTYCGVHGDFDGSAGKIQDLQSMVGGPLYAVLSAHYHHNEIGTVQGVKTVMAGSFLGMDDLCVQRRIVGRPEQIVCVCNERGIVCSYDVPLATN